MLHLVGDLFELLGHLDRVLVRRFHDVVANKVTVTSLCPSVPKSICPDGRHDTQQSDFREDSHLKLLPKFVATFPFRSNYHKNNIFCMNTCIHYDIWLLLVFVIGTDGVMCEVRAEDEERVGDRNVSSERYQL